MKLIAERYCDGCGLPTAATEYHEDDECAYPLHEYGTRIRAVFRR